ncbi:MAG TPA: lipoate--protein ligase [Oscillospiraceae bacterium]|nr:lipoate--protein ligase [Oscillospiraceae bacterium]HPS34532.1 lipoate--protein ligase [Oscillospiraceae bacterium]
MKLIINRNTEPAYNLAFEEYFLTYAQGEYILLWQNRPAVVVGCNQNVYREINFTALEQKNIALVRRQTGGGAVYHDLGNINYSFITPYEQGDLSTIRKFCEPIIGYLGTLGVHAEFSGRNDLLADGMKFSGNAQAVRKNRLLHHGTLLFDTDLSVLSAVLSPSAKKYAGKGIDSIRSRVTNLRPLLKNDMTTEEFFQGLTDFFLSKSCQTAALEKAAPGIISAICREKYSSRLWTYGENPTYKFSNENRFDFGEVSVGFDCFDGRISGLKIGGDFLLKRPTSELCAAVNGTLHEKAALLERVTKLRLNDYIEGIKPEEFTMLFF